MKRLVIITGASRGLGFALAQEFLSGGYDVLISSKDIQALADARKKFDTDVLPRLHTVPMDLNDAASVNNFCTSVSELDYKSLILVNNAGLGHISPADQITEEDFEQVFNVNFFGHLKLIRSFLPMLKNGGSIINIFSILALRPIRYWSLYASAKSAFATFAIGMQMERDHHGINILNIFPGKIKTGFSSRAVGGGDKNDSVGIGGVSPDILAHKIFKRFQRNENGQFFYPGSLRFLFLLHALSMDMTTQLLNFLLRKSEK